MVQTAFLAHCATSPVLRLEADLTSGSLVLKRSFPKTEGKNPQCSGFNSISGTVIMWFPQKKSIDFLNKALSLPSTGHEQDWELELSDPARIKEFIEFYKNNHHLDFDIKCSLMALLIASFEDSFFDSRFDFSLWKRFLGISRKEVNVFKKSSFLWTQKDAEQSEFVVFLKKNVINF